MAPSTMGLPTGADVVEKLDEISQIIHASLRPLPIQTGDATYLDDDKGKVSDLIQKLKAFNIHELESIGETIAAAVRGVKGGFIDDRSYLMEALIGAVAGLPVTSPGSLKATDALMGVLWKDLQHPPQSYLGKEFVYRKADGSNNNILWPQIGVAKSPYARTVKPMTIQPIARPDPGVIFDTLMKRDKFKAHPNKISSNLFYLASIIIHDIFHTSHEDYAISETSSYLDLAPLYGSNDDDQAMMRTHKDGRIKPDCFSDKRILGFPPGVGLLLIMFNRFHNYIAEQLALIDEDGRFSTIRNPVGKKPPANADALYDNALFQTARLITGGLYINIILKDYVRTILNLNRTNSAWDLDPRTESGKSIFGDGAGQATGNQVSAEFNLLYRWHSCISQRDEEWSKRAFDKITGGKTPANTGELLKELGKWAASLPKDPHERPFEGLRRTNGSFSDDDLGAMFTACVKDCAGSFGARNVPEVMRDVEILGILQARSWNLASLNEFRKHFNLAPHTTFESINPEIADELKHLYDHPDFVELYPGMVIESTKRPIVPGSGLCTTYTTSRGILSDAVSLVRGDRFYTIDYTPRNLTNFGYNAANYDLTVDNGCVFYKLVLRALPQQYKSNSVYAHFPLTVPEENLKIFTDLEQQGAPGLLSAYDFSEPMAIPNLTIVKGVSACRKILADDANYKVVWGKDTIQFLLQHDGKPYGRDFMLAGDGPLNHSSRQLMESSLYMENWNREVKAFYEDITLKLLERNSYKLAGVNQVDIVRDVANPAQVNFAASVFSLSLKTEANPHGVFSEVELYTVLAVIFAAIFYDADPASSFPLRQGARKVAQQLGQLVQLNVESVSKTGVLANLVDSFYKHDALTDYGLHLVQHLLQHKRDPKDIVWNDVLPTAGAMVANQAQVFSQVLDFYLLPENKAHLDEIQRLSVQNTPEADNLLERYYLEGSRLASAVGVYRESVSATEFKDGDKSTRVEAGHRIFCDVRATCRDPSVFPDPEKIILTRDEKSYMHYGWGPHKCLGFDLSKVALTTMLKTVGKLKNLRRAHGPQGHIKQVIGAFGYPVYLTEDQRTFWPFPSSMKINWDGPLPSK